MLILLPPSETKRDGGTGAKLDVAALSFSRLTPQRRATVRALRELSGDREASIRVLKLGPKQHGEVDRNRVIATAPTMAAMDRYTGVLFDGMDAASLSETERAFAGQHVFIQSALFGPISAADAIPAYRLSHNSRLPELPLKKHWAPAVSRELAAAGGLVLDLRSEAYVDLGPAPAGSWYLRVVSEGPDGTVRALNHFNKKAKGEFTRALIQAGVDHADTASLIAWADAAGWRLRESAATTLELTV